MRDNLCLSPRDRLIFACDYSDMPEAMLALHGLRGHINMVKIGMQMFTEFGPQIIKAVKAQGFRVWLDLKYLDIPNTVKGAVESAQTMNVDMITIHLLGGTEMIKAAVAVTEQTTMPIVLGVSILTSIDETQLMTLGFRYDMEHQVRNLVHLGEHAGVHGIVCSPRETTSLRKLHPNLIIINPGIRPSSYAQVDDQKRVATPYSAIKDGADFIVVGRAIKNTTNKEEICDEIVGEIKQALTDKEDK